MAIRLSCSPNTVLHSNRAAAYAGMAYWGRSLEDAGVCVRVCVCVYVLLRMRVCWSGLLGQELEDAGVLCAFTYVCMLEWPTGAGA